MRRQQKVEANAGGTVMQSQTPKWVKDMHAHYNETGSYRAEDVQRVLGDPRKSVGAPTSEQLAAASRIRRD